MDKDIDYAKLLKQSNNADYAAVLKKLKEKFGVEMPPETPIQYTVGRMCGFSGIGHVVAGIVETPKGRALIMFMHWTKEKDGRVHMDTEVLSINGTYKLNPDAGEFVLEDSTLGDKETFFKYINMIPTYLDGRGYLIKDPRELVGKNGQD